MSGLELNADLGESFGIYRHGDDQAVMAYVDSVNVACGFHGGDPSIMRHSVAAAARRGLRIGAHIGLNDREGFGRRRIDITPAQAYDSALYQIGALQAFLMAAGESLNHVKPHGALYMMACEDTELAEAIVAASRRINPALQIYGLPGSRLLEAADAAGMPTVPEYFADRPYAASEVQMFGWTPEQLGTPEDVADRVRHMRLNPNFASIATVCVHSDTPGAPAIAAAVRAAISQPSESLTSTK
ncbi:5-oxoprolinase subunit PxpA [Nesterenkonia populi]|uniref:5-oxoprolinase subunit PxpA n=1 Tax=Nesterenkonia populi TaxID=1591087 RepID=UPI001B85F6E1|nr:5-oxoprolinase subunit PxpA [Nesterenkonia populi]